MNKPGYFLGTGSRQKSLFHIPQDHREGQTYHLIIYKFPLQAKGACEHVST